MHPHSAAFSASPSSPPHVGGASASTAPCWRDPCGQTAQRVSCLCSFYPVPVSPLAPSPLPTPAPSPRPRHAQGGQQCAGRPGRARLWSGSLGQGRPNPWHNSLAEALLPPGPPFQQPPILVRSLPECLGTLCQACSFVTLLSTCGLRPRTVPPSSAPWPPSDLGAEVADVTASGSGSAGRGGRCAPGQSGGLRETGSPDDIVILQMTVLPRGRWNLRLFPYPMSRSARTAGTPRLREAAL